MFQFSTAHWCERKIGAASGQAGPEVWPSRTHVQNGKRLAAYGALALIEKPLTATMESLAKTIARGTPKGSQFSLTKRLCRAEVLNMELSHGKDADHDGQSHDHELRDEKWRLRLCWGHRFHRRYFLEQLSYQYEHVQIQTDHNNY
jgi:hypothetical protein